MNIRVKVFVLAFMLLSGVGVSAQSDTVYMSAAQAEELFLRRNLQLIAEKLNIDKAAAAIVQARLWQNPNFSFDGLNLWTSKAQRQGEDEIVPPLFGSFARNTTFAVGVEQMIQLAGKRRKLIALEQLSKDMAEQYFEELLRSLKVELRNACNDLLYMQEYRTTLESQMQTLNRLVANQRAQIEQGNL